MVLAVGFAAECHQPHVPIPVFLTAFIAVSLAYWDDRDAASYPRSHINSDLYKLAAFVFALLIAAGCGLPSFLMRKMFGYMLGMDYMMLFLAAATTGDMTHVVIVKEGYTTPPPTPPQCKATVPRGPNFFSFCPSLSPSFQPIRPLVERNTVTLRRLLVESRIDGPFLLRALSQEEACQDTCLLAALREEHLIISGVTVIEHEFQTRYVQITRNGFTTHVPPLWAWRAFG